MKNGKTDDMGLRLQLLAMVNGEEKSRRDNIRPKNVALFLNLSFTVEFKELIYLCALLFVLRRSESVEGST